MSHATTQAKKDDVVSVPYDKVWEVGLKYFRNSGKEIIWHGAFLKDSSKTIPNQE